MTLQSALQVKAELLGNLTVKQKLGEGGQGAVYLVEGAYGSYALKWYNREQATEEQRKAIRDLAQAGAPRGAAGKRFIWPLDLVTATGTTQFGYLMQLIDTRRFAELGEVWARLKPRPSFTALCEISYQVANSYRTLHLSGYCYRDISAGNLMFDPVTGEVLICDNDNVGINRQSTCQVLGTMEYMAPEIIRGEASPSTESDLHSLAVLLFQLWTWHHPMQGRLEHQVRCWDLPAKRRVYGERPIFIFDPHDKHNRLSHDYTAVRILWALCPKPLQEQFTRAFTIGLKEPAQRVTEGEWQRLFLQLKDGILPCRGCKAENFWQPAIRALHCWNCRQPIPLPPALRFNHRGGSHFLLLTLHTKLTKRHLNPHANETEAATVVGQVVQNPANPQIWGIRNLTSTPWQATFSNGATKRIPPQRAVPISTGVRVNIGGTMGEIVV